MNTIDRTVPVWFRVVVSAILIWELIGCYAWLQQVRLGADSMGPATDYDRALFASLPVWYNAVYGVAVVAGAGAALAMLLRSGLARPLAIASLIAVIVMFGWVFLATDLIAVKGPAVAMTFPLFIFALSVFIVWLSRLATRRGWIG